MNLDIFFDFILGAGTAAFTSIGQLSKYGGPAKTEFPVHVWTLCDWKTAWSLLFKPIETDQERAEIKKELKVCFICNRFSSKKLT